MTPEGLTVAGLLTGGAMVLIVTAIIWKMPEDPQAAKWRNAVVVKVCRDGTAIYRLAPGEFWASGAWRRVDNVDSVCG